MPVPGYHRRAAGVGAGLGEAPGEVRGAAVEQVAARAVADAGAAGDRVAAEVPVVPVDPLEAPEV